MANERTFIGLTRVKRFDNGGSIIKLGIKVEDLKPHINEGGWVNLIITKKKEAKGDDKDYYTYVDEYKPKIYEQAQPEQHKEEVVERTEEEDKTLEDIPF